MLQGHLIEGREEFEKPWGAQMIIDSLLVDALQLAAGGSFARFEMNQRALRLESVPIPSRVLAVDYLLNPVSLVYSGRCPVGSYLK